MPIALDPRATFEYVLECDRMLPEEERTVFELRGLTVAEEARVADAMITSTPGADELNFRSGTHQLTVRRAGLKDWRSFQDSEGNDIPFPTGKGHPRHVTDEGLDRLLPAWRQELVNAIMERGGATEAEGN